MRTALRAFEGEIEQVPSTVSAIKVGGKRAYALARAGEDVELEPRRVTVHGLKAGEVPVPATTQHRVDVEISVSCSSGTYIRAIARDLGAALGVGGHLTALRRHSVGPFNLDSANTDLDHLTMTPLAEAARAAFPSYDLDAEQAQAVRYGRALPFDLDPLTAVFAPGGEFLALYRPEGGRARPAAVFVG